MLAALLLGGCCIDFGSESRVHVYGSELESQGTRVVMWLADRDAGSVRFMVQDGDGPRDGQARGRRASSLPAIPAAEAVRAIDQVAPDLKSLVAIVPGGISPEGRRRVSELAAEISMLHPTASMHLIQVDAPEDATWFDVGDANAFEATLDRLADKAQKSRPAEGGFLDQLARTLEATALFVEADPVIAVAAPLAGESGRLAAGARRLTALEGGISTAEGTTPELLDRIGWHVGEKGGPLLFLIVPAGCPPEAEARLRAFADAVVQEWPETWLRIHPVRKPFAELADAEALDRILN